MWSTLAIAGVVVLLLAGCEEDVVAVRGTDMPFTLYGVLTPEADTQRVRVFPVEDQLLPARPEPLDARFASVNLETGEVWLWRDSLLQEADGHYTHVFWAPFQATYGHTYRLEVEHSDGAMTHVEVAVPPHVVLVPQEPIIHYPSFNFPSRVTAPVLAPGAPRLLQLEVEYYYQFDFENTSRPFNKERAVLPYDTWTRQVMEGWVIDINLHWDWRFIEALLEERGLINRDHGIVLLDMALRMVVVDASWDPRGGTFEPGVLVQPGVLQNVENGYGFVGAGYHLEQHWQPPDEVLEAAGFRIR